MKEPPAGIGVAGVKANVTVAHVERATRSEEAMANDNEVTEDPIAVAIIAIKIVPRSSSPGIEK